MKINSNKKNVKAKNENPIHLSLYSMYMSANNDFNNTHIKNLRKKLMHAGGADYIKSVYGMGYKFSLS